jgi:hypothetical protein
MPKINPAEIRDANWHSLRAHLSGRLKAVYAAWVVHGPATTRALATRSGMDILNIRPRTTDLVKLGLVECVHVDHGEGVYRARSQAEWEAWADSFRSMPYGQLALI